MEGPHPGVWDTQLEEFQEDCRRHNYVHHIMCSSMPQYLSEKFMYSAPFEIFQELKEMFKDKVRAYIFDMIKEFVSCKMTEGQDLNEHLKLMKQYLHELEIFGAPLSKEFADGVILTSLSPCFELVGAQALHSFMEECDILVEDKGQNKGQVSGINVIEINLASTSDWVLNC